MTYASQVANILMGKLKNKEISQLGIDEIKEYIKQDKPWYTEREIKIFADETVTKVVKLADEYRAVVSLTTIK